MYISICENIYTCIQKYKRLDIVCMHPPAPASPWPRRGRSRDHRRCATLPCLRFCLVGFAPFLPGSWPCRPFQLLQLPDFAFSWCSWPRLLPTCVSMACRDCRMAPANTSKRVRIFFAVCFVFAFQCGPLVLATCCILEQEPLIC